MSLSNHTAHPINNQQKETEIITTKGYANKVLTCDYCRYFRQVGVANILGGQLILFN